METVRDFILGGSKTTADGDCSIKTLAPWKKSYDLPRQHIKEQRLYFVDKVHVVNDMVFPGVMYGCESWTIKKTECQRIDAFELWCWRRLLTWTAWRSNQSISKEISLEYSLKGLMLKLKLQHFGQSMRRANSLERHRCWKRLKARGEGNDRGWDGWMASPTQWTWVWASSRRGWRTGKPGLLQFMGSQRVGRNWVTELTDWAPFFLHRIAGTSPQPHDAAQSLVLGGCS